jgi:hypothetical protein
MHACSPRSCVAAVQTASKVVSESILQIGEENIVFFHSLEAASPFMSLHAPPAATSPFPSADADRQQIWQMLVPRDTEAFLNQDWAAVASDFITEGFYGVDARRHPNPDEWRIAYPSLAAYRDEWLRQAAITAGQVDREAAQAAFLTAVTLTDIEIAGDCAIAHKKFNGRLPNLDGSFEELHWQTLYVCRKQDARWKIASFVGYLPYAGEVQP